MDAIQTHEICSTSLIFREMHIKPAPIRMPKVKRLTLPSIGKDMQELGLSFSIIASWNAK